VLRRLRRSHQSWGEKEKEEEKERAKKEKKKEKKRKKRGGGKRERERERERWAHLVLICETNENILSLHRLLACLLVSEDQIDPLVKVGRHIV
jgi:hypothetical protein